MNTRYFEFVGGSSAKFWEIGVRGQDVAIRFGRIDTQGQSQTKSFPNETAANRHAAKLIAAKTAKGYLETVPR
ncbi:MAG: WGR domain-containing protein [Pirellulales bacterium]